MLDPRNIRRNAASAARDESLQAAVRKACDHSLSARATALARLPDPEGARQAATEVRTQSAQRMGDLVRKLSRRLEASGITVHRAATADEARRAVGDLVRSRGVRSVVKAKTMTGEEVDLAGAIESAGCRVVETDLGEFIVQLRGERPSHILAPALHLSRAEIGRLFARCLGMDSSDDPAAMAAFARRHLRAEFQSADMGVIGVNLAVASTGDLVTVSNEGNARLCATLPPLLVAFMGIEKVVATPEDAAAVLRVLPRNATGQIATTYVSVLRGPARAGEPFGPREVHLVLLDNGRSRIATDPDLKDILRCIRCGACLNVCPVYRTIGGHAYGTTYPGPMGILWTAGLAGVSHARDLVYASTLCGECTRVCPVGIDLAGAIRRLRARVPRPFLRRVVFAAARWVLASAARFEAVGRAAAWIGRTWPGLFRRIAGWAGWTTPADLPVPAPRSFRRLWTESEGAAGPARSRDRAPQDTTDPCRAACPDAARSPDATDSRPAGIEDADTRDERGGLAGVHPHGSPLRTFLARFGEASGEVVRAADVTQGMREVAAKVRPEAALVSADAEAQGAGEALQALAVRVVPESVSTRDEAARADLGVTGCLALVAETGSVLLAHPDGRAASLLPDTHVVLARADQVVASLEDALARTRDRGEPSCTFVTGPSRTADIEKTLVIGMHGPRRLILVLLQEDGLDGRSDNETR